MLPCCSRSKHQSVSGFRLGHSSSKLFFSFNFQFWIFCLTHFLLVDFFLVLKCLKKRYEKDRIYTSMRNHLISMNPGQPIDHLYSSEEMSRVGVSVKIFFFNSNNLIFLYFSRDFLMDNRISDNCRLALMRRTSFRLAPRPWRMLSWKNKGAALSWSSAVNPEQEK